MKSFFKTGKRSRTILNIDYGGVQLVQMQSEHGGANIVGFAQKGWSDEERRAICSGKELPPAHLEKIKDTFRSLIGSDRHGGKELDILLPDCIARIKILDLASLPSKSDELFKLIYFKGQKNPPYSFEDTRIGIQALPGDQGEGKVRVLAVFASRALMEGYEKILCDLGLEPGRIELATFNLCNLFEAELSREEDTVFVAAFEGFFSLSLFSKGLPVFIRSKLLDTKDGGLFFEVKTSFLYYQNQNSTYRPRRVLLWGINEKSDVVAWLEELVAVKPGVLGPHVPLTIKPGLSISPEELMRLAPAAGMVIK